MTVYRRPLCLALALVLLLLLIPSGIGGNHTAVAETKRYGITLDSVNLRYGSSTGAKIVFSLPKDQVCVILDERKSEGLHWFRVETINPERKNSNTYYGFLHGDFFRELTPQEYSYYLSSGVPSTPTPIPQSVGGQPTPTPTPPLAPAVSTDLPAQSGSVGVVTAGGTNFREGPGTSFHSIERLDRNTQVELLTIPSVRGPGTGTFFKVKYNNTVGYIMSDFISIVSGGPSSGQSVAVTAAPAAAGSGTSGTTGSTGSSGTSGSFTHVKLILTSCHLRTSPGGDYDINQDWVGQGTTLPDGYKVAAGTQVNNETLGEGK